MLAYEYTEQTDAWRDWHPIFAMVAKKILVIHGEGG